MRTTVAPVSSLRIFMTHVLLGVPLVLGLGLTACTEPPSRAGHAEGEHGKPKADEGGANAGAAKDGAKDRARADKPGTKPAAAKRKGDGEADADDGCCRYCPEGEVPCGDGCLPKTSSCENTAESCACEWSKRTPKTFRKGDQALSGLIRADVLAYNAAQGDPIQGEFTLEKAFEGAPELSDTAGGKLWATLETNQGTIECELYEEWAPLTVANFVGLARGKRPWRDPRDQQWKTEPFFDGVIFHRVIADFMIQGGDKLGTGMGSTGFFVPDEFHPKARHSGAGVLSMANRNRIDPIKQGLNVDPKTGQTIGNTGSAQFFITVTATPDLDDRHSVFGKCDPKVPVKISKVETITNRAQRLDHKPAQDVKIERVTFTRRK